MGTIEVNPISDLEQVRAIINKFIQDQTDSSLRISPEWCFVDCKLPLFLFYRKEMRCSFAACTAERFFRIDKAQENLHYISDIACENLYILECGGGTVPQTPEDETALPSPNSNYQAPYVIPEMRIRYDNFHFNPILKQLFIVG